MARLVVSGELSGAVGHLLALLLRAHTDLEDGLLDVRAGDKALAPAHSQKRGLIHQVLQVRAGKAGCPLRHGVEIHIVTQRLAAGVDLQDGLAPADIGQADVDLAVETAGAQQGVVKDIRAVGGCHDDDAVVVAEAVHLHKQLVQSLLTLVVSAAEAGAALAAHGVDLVDEHDGRVLLLRLLEQVAHAPRADADVELHEVRAGDREELHVRLARDGLCQQGLAGARRADQQHALGDARADLGVFLRVLEEVDDLLELLLLLLAARHIGEGGLFLLLAAKAGPGLAEPGHAARAAALHPVHGDSLRSDRAGTRPTRAPAIPAGN